MFVPVTIKMILMLRIITFVVIKFLFDRRFNAKEIGLYHKYHVEDRSVAPV